MASNPRRVSSPRLLAFSLCAVIGAGAAPACSSSKGGGPDSGAGTGGATGDGGATGTGGSAEGGAGGTAGAGGGADAQAGSDGAGTSCAGNAISFSANGTGTASDAAHARVMVDLMSDLPSGNANRTVEFWAYVKSTDWHGDTNTMFEYGSQNGTNAGFGLDFGGVAGSIDPYVNGGSLDNDNQPTGLDATMDQWIHFAVTWDGTTMRAYANGVQKAMKSATTGCNMSANDPCTLHTTVTQLTIGCNNPRFACFNGWIDEFRVWNVARSATDIMSNYNKGLVGDEAGLVGYWKFDETSGTTAADSVTSAGHTAHPGMLMAVTPATQNPTFGAPPSPAPILCP
jgi:hypothetical protein